MMVESISVNLDVVEALLFFWQSIKDRKKVSERFIYDVMAMQGLKDAYDDEFNQESVRGALSAITNREVYSGRNRKEGRFYSNNLWMLEDPNYTDRMVQLVKKLNLHSLVDKINATQTSGHFRELEVIFSPLHFEEYIIKNNKLIINFFAVRPSDTGEGVYIGEKEWLSFIEEKLIELIHKSDV
ncbi:hypothetical protein SOV_47970 [Sporomusa ovata DSM 2662]|uniref:Uncharacterized protein n=1 Tax=Sporomusa ovata TaxID=2378 RepID=A0A0U1L010_9FIRM|nr:hypothetical protein [Sporomusa ovata]EQB27174.1 hypothetical protein SOV_2c00660 [Sporomusa ovata DSM 2662]CQR73010.1 hypothetical protein SpAn4DRAFT_2242 [Sporomusa ovata]